VTVVGPYTSYAHNLRALHSASAIVHDETGQAVAALCINVNLGRVHDLQRTLAALLPNNRSTETSSEPQGEHQTMEDLVTEIIESSIEAHGTDVARMRKSEKMKSVAAMKRRLML
jgi:predicted transcriptional regulator YheO